VEDCLRPRVQTPAVRSTTELLNRRWLSERALELELSRPAHFHFTAGQSIQLIHQDHKRYYSPISGTADRNVSLCVNFLEHGYFSTLLATVQPGFRFGFSGPHGYFTQCPSPHPYVLIATDTGIAPFVSMVRSGLRGFTLFQGARHPNELYYRDILRKAAGTYIPILWRDHAGDTQTTACGGYGIMRHVIVQNLLPGVYAFYLCGCLQMIKDVTRLVDEYYPGSHVFTEVFYE
jgi:benzoate/toluate 1,2-dioxygenase reductase component